MTPQELFDSAQALVPSLKERAVETEQRRMLSKEVIADLFAAGLLRYFQPTRYGGYAMDWGIQYDLGRIVAKGCPSTAWIVCVVGGHSAFVGRFAEKAQDEVWGDASDVLIATVSVQKTGTVRKVDGGFRLDGTWGFASGVDHAAWVMVAGRMPGDTEASQYLIPRSEFSIDDVWHVTGMKGTGTKDVIVHDSFVPPYRVLPQSVFHGANPPGAKINSHYIYASEFRPFMGSSMLGPIVGTAEAAMADYLDSTRARKSAIFGNRVAESPIVQTRVAESAAELNAADAVARRQLARLNARGKAAEPFPPNERVEAARDRAFIMKLCVDAAERLVRMMGASGIYDTNVVQRHFRDLHAMATQIGVNWDLNMLPYGRWALGLSPNAQAPAARD